MAKNRVPVSKVISVFFLVYMLGKLGIEMGNEYAPEEFIKRMSDKA